MRLKKQIMEMKENSETITDMIVDSHKKLLLATRSSDKLNY